MLTHIFLDRFHPFEASLNLGKQIYPFEKLEKFMPTHLNSCESLLFPRESSYRQLSDVATEQEACCQQAFPVEVAWQNLNPSKTQTVQRQLEWHSCHLEPYCSPPPPPAVLQQDGALCWPQAARRGGHRSSLKSWGAPFHFISLNQLATFLSSRFVDKKNDGFVLCIHYLEYIYMYIYIYYAIRGNTIGVEQQEAQKRFQ